MLLTVVVVLSGFGIAGLFAFAYLMDKWHGVVCMAALAVWVYGMQPAEAQTIDSNVTINGVTYHSHTTVDAAGTVHSDVTQTAPRGSSEVRAVAHVGDKFYVLFNGLTMPNGMSMYVVYDAHGHLLGRGGYVSGDGFTLYDAFGKQLYVPSIDAGMVQRQNLRATLDYRCRGDSGDDSITQLACQVRDLL